MEQMMKIDKCCCTCIHCDRRAEKGHTSTYCDLDDEYPMSGAFYCANRDGEFYGDYTEYDDGCDEWEGDEE